MTALARIARAFARMALQATPGAIDCARDRISHGSGGHGKHGVTTSAPSFGSDRPLVVYWAERLAAYADAMEADLDGGLPAPPASGGARAHDEMDRRTIIASEAVHSLDVAYRVRRSQRWVEQVRSRAGLHPQTGERLPHTAVTARARDQHDAYLNPPEED